MHELSKLLFELSSEDRLNILFELRKSPMKLSRISEKLNSTVPETSRNIIRLSEANLINKETDGNFHLTPLGEGVLNLLSGFKFLSKNRKYFMTHTMSNLPPEFSAGVGTLADASFIKDVATTIFCSENLCKEAQEFIWVIVDQIVVRLLPIVGEAVARGVEFKKLMPRNAEEEIPKTIHSLANDPIFDRAARAKKLESRYLERIELFILMTEKEAVVLFPNLEGRFDFTGFQTKNEAALDWLKSLFMYYYNRAKQ